MTTPKPRGRPSTFDRQAALAAATELFWQHGYEGTSIADLTAAMGVTPPTLYAAFGSKEQLYREVLWRYLMGEGEPREGLGDDSTAYDLLSRHLSRLVDLFTDPSKPGGCMLQTAALACAAENEPARAIAASMRAKAFSMLVAKLEWATQVGELPDGTDVQALARFYSAVVQGMSVQAIDGASATDLRAMADIALSAWPGKR